MPTILRMVMAVVLFAVGAAGRADVTVVEYHHSGFDHFFVTPVAAEIALLDAKAPPFELWSRTGVTFRVYDSSAAPAGSVAICRFFNSSFAPKSSHFYAPRGLGCEDTLAKYPDWGLEDDRLFAVMLPAGDGTCPAATVPVYRLYNNGQTGAPNHRFVLSLAERQGMLDRGYVAEGAGIGVGMCVPATGAGTAEGLWRGTTSHGQALRIFILDDGSCYIVYSAPGGQAEVGVLYGSIAAADGQLASTQVADYSLSAAPASFAGGAARIAGTYVAGETLQFSNGTSSVSATYDDAYDHQVSLASLVGTYSVKLGHITESFQVSGDIDGQGRLTVRGLQCTFAVSLAPRGSKNVFDMFVSSGTCYKGPGVFFYDAPSRTFHALAQFENALLGFPDMFHMIGTRQ